MASYPTSIVSLTNPSGTSLLISPDHGALHTSVNNEVVAIETTLGTTAGTAIAKNFAQGDFALGLRSSRYVIGASGNRVLDLPDTGNANYIQLQNTAGTAAPTINAVGTASTLNLSLSAQGAGGIITLISPLQGTINNSTFGTVNVTGGTINAAAFNGGTSGTLTNTGGLSLAANGSITQTSTADHLTLTPGASKLVRTAVLEQDGTTNTYRNNAVVLTGWSFITGDGTTVNFLRSVTFGITFTTNPVVSFSFLGTKDTSDPTIITDFTQANNGNLFYPSQLYGISTTGFTLSINASSALTNGRRYGFAWTAIGAL